MDIKSKMMKEFQTYINQITKDIMSKYESSLDQLIVTQSDPSPKPDTLEDKPKKEEDKEVKEEPKKAPSKSKKAVKEEKEPIPFEETLGAIAVATKTQLNAMCKKYGLPCTGKMEDLVGRLREYRNKYPPVGGSEKEDETEVSKESEKGGSLLKMGITKTAVKKTAVAVQPPVVKKLLANAPVHKLARNKFGNFEHTETKLVFDREDKVVIGRQDPSGTILELTDEDIEICKQFKFNYKLPENLDIQKKGLKHVKVEEVDEELSENDMAEDFSDDGGEEGEEDEFDEE